MGAYWQEKDITEAEEADKSEKAKAAAADKVTNMLVANQVEDLRYAQQAADAEKRVKEQGAMGWVAVHQNAIAEIQVQEQGRLAKVQEDETKELAIAKGNAAAEEQVYASAANRQVDIEREAAAQIEQQQQAMTQRLSGLMESAFRDPIGTIKSTMEKLMFDLLAQRVMHFKMVQALMGSSLNAGQLSGGAAHAAGGLAGGVVGHMLGGCGSASQTAAQTAQAS